MRRCGLRECADWITVPRNLCHLSGWRLDARRPTTPSAIALQGVRRTEPQLGETIAVVGLGLIGQISVQLLAPTAAASRPRPRLRARRARAVLGLDTGASDPTAFATRARPLDRARCRRDRRSPPRRARPGRQRSDGRDPPSRTRRSRRRCRDGSRAPRVLQARTRLTRRHGPGRYDTDYEEGGRTIRTHMCVDAQPQHAELPRDDLEWRVRSNRSSTGSTTSPSRRTPTRSSSARRLRRSACSLIPGGDRCRGAGGLDAHHAARTSSTRRTRTARPLGVVRADRCGAFRYMLVPTISERRDRFFLRGVVGRDQKGGNFARENRVELQRPNSTTCCRIGHRTRRDLDASLRALEQVIRSLGARQARLRRKPLARPGTTRADRGHRGARHAALLMCGFNRRSPAVLKLEILGERSDRS